MGIFSAELIQTLEELEPSLRKAFIKILQKIEQAIGETVRREDFVELKNIVKAIAEEQRKLAEAQARTEEELRRLSEEQRKLAEAQARTEEELRRLSEAQRKTEEEIKKLSEAQRKTEEEVRKLSEGLHQLRKEFGGFTRSNSYGFENEAYRNLPKVLKEKYGIEITEKFVRTEIEDEEINFFAKGRINGKEILIVGETKLRFDDKKKDFEKTLKELERKAKAIKKVYGEKEIIRIIVTHFARPRALKMAEDQGLLVIQSFEW
ncbi:MAG: hypothetical protein ACP5HI_05595 [Caldimicrobium sp.]|jgi:chromosome segregation ATPase